ncbi:phage tail protein [Pseudomonas paracarnis]|uniref:phage tail protein n=1 Tax=Pseudomonas paracarnis TaxID=2750625 RepID=UPI00249AD10B|nr:phage tail protein [Pseudomonas paracarnis]MDI3184649.1 phage tail protein [Pseudomonas paracarnis]
MSRQPFNTRWAQGVESEDNLNTFKDPGDVRISTGWEGGQDKDAPPAGHENYWHNRVDSALQGMERNGVMAWHPEAIYGIGAPTYSANGNYYESIASPNVGNNPDTAVGFWRYRGSSFFSGSEPGDIKMVCHNNPPSIGWLKCNGAVLVRSSYPLLFSVIGTTHNTGGETPLQFRIPDYRGEFIRGFDDGRGVDPGRVFESPQYGQNASHSHRLQYSNLNTGSGQNVTGSTGTGSISDVAVESSGGNEARPRNKAVNFWIKY